MEFSTSHKCFAFSNKASDNDRGVVSKTYPKKSILPLIAVPLHFEALTSNPIILNKAIAAFITNTDYPCLHTMTTSSAKTTTSITSECSRFKPAIMWSMVPAKINGLKAQP